MMISVSLFMFSVMTWTVTPHNTSDVILSNVRGLLLSPVITDCDVTEAVQPVTDKRLDVFLLNIDQLEVM